eukprot:COSAG05_NODE_16059_length_354_cov_1.027451_1_plen_80_part_00
MYTFAEQVALQDRETQARDIAAVTKEGNIFTSGSVETEFDIFSRPMMIGLLVDGGSRLTSTKIIIWAGYRLILLVNKQH